jgi:hypothetical protein
MTFTGSGPCWGAAFLLHPAAARQIDKIPMLRRMFFIERDIN